MSLKLSFVCVIALGIGSGCGSNDATTGNAAEGNDAGLPANGARTVDGGATPQEEAKCLVDVAPEANVVVTLRGAVRGKVSAGGGSVSFKGIPYAEPPTGARRFRAPISHACWSGVRDAFAYGSECAQAGVTGAATGDEDCLSLNVWVPSSSSGALPVLYFIHGGAEIVGGSNQQLGTGNLYDGQALAERQHAIVVTTNYRLGALGFLAHPALDAENASGRRSGNYGLLDLLSSLRWVKKNIASFGGDPARVMIFGESAGALNTCVLVASPQAAGLFSSALMESGGCAAPSTVDREKSGNVLATSVGCAEKPDVAACLRGKPAADLVSASAGLTDLLASDLLHTWDMPYGPNVDGYVLTEAPLSAFKSGRYNHVPFAVGSNAHEMELFITPGQVNTCYDYDPSSFAHGRSNRTWPPRPRRRSPTRSRVTGRASERRGIRMAESPCRGRRTKL
jgi:para-nitrobenzyl esterase